MFKRLWLGFICLLYVGGLAFIFTQSNKQPVSTFGAGYSPVTGYETRTTSYVSASATTIPVASVNDKAGNAISTALISSSSTVRMYFNLEAGTSREEPFFCTGISGLNLTGCVRGIAFQGSGLSTSSTIAVAHNAGAKIILTNLGVMYGNEFVGISGTQTIYDVKSFDTLPRATSTTAVPASNAEFTTWYAAQTLIAGGFSSLNASTTLGLQTFTGLSNCSTSGTCVGLNASSTASTNGGFLNFVAGSGKLYWDVISFLAGSWTFSGTNVFSGTVTISNALGNILKVPSATTSTTSGLVAVNFDTLTQFSATGTAGVNITAGQALYVTPTGTLALTSAARTTTTYPYVGFSQTAANAGDVVLYTRPGGVVRGLSLLTPGRNYYLSNTPGFATSTQPESVPAMVGRAMTTSTLQLLTPDFHAYWTNVINYGAGYSEFNVGWIPNKITAVIAASGTEMWQLNNSNFSPALPHNVSSTQATCIGDWFAPTSTGSVTGFAWNRVCAGGQSTTIFAEYTLPGIDLH